VWFAVFNTPVLAKEHLPPIMAAENPGRKRLGLHYNRFSIAGAERKTLRP
jgi:hypothetical protein